MQQDKEEEEREDSLELENLFYENTEPKPQLEPQIQPMDIPQKILPFQELLPAPLDAVSSRTRSRCSTRYRALQGRVKPNSHPPFIPVAEDCKPAPESFH